MKLHDLNAELSALAACLAPAYLKTALSVLKPEHFHNEANRAFFEAIKDLDQKGSPVDSVTLGAITGNHDHAQRLEDANFTGSNVKAYAAILEDCRINRQLRLLGEYLMEVDDEAELKREKALAMLQGVTKQEAATRSLAECLKSLIPELERRFESRGATLGLVTGFRALDERYRGLRDGDLVIIAGRPSSGKTTLAFNIAANSAKPDRATLIFSLEISSQAVAEKMLACAGRISFPAIRNGDVFGNHPHNDRIMPAVAKLKTLGIYVNDSAQTIAQMKAACYRFHAEKPLQLIVVDYLQLMTGDNKNSREQEVSGLSRGLKGLAREFGCPVICLSQLNRGLEARSDKRPVMADLRESGAIEQDADIIAMIYRDEVYNPETPDKGTAEILTRKFRNGEIGVDYLAFIGSQSRFDDLPPEYKPASTSTKTKSGVDF